MSYTRNRCSTLVSQPRALGGLSEACRERRRVACEPLESRRLLAAGNLDPTFGGDGKVEMYWPDLPGIPLNVTDMAMQYSDGKMVVVGHRSGNPAAARFNSDGTLDTSFGNGGVFQWPTSELINGTMTRVSTVAIQGDGKIVAAGQAYRLFTLGQDPEDYFAVARLHSNGTPDLSWGDSGVHVTGFGSNDMANDVTIQRDGKILAVGSAVIGTIFADSDFVAARYNANGTLDSSFGSGGKVVVDVDYNDYAGSVAIDYSGNPTTNPRYGRIVIGGTLSNDDVTRFALVRLLPNGSMDNSFDGNGKLTTVFPGDPIARGSGVVIQPTGKIVIAGIVYGNNADDFGMARYHVNGAIDTTFGPNGTGTVQTDFLGPTVITNDWATDITIGFSGGLLVSGAQTVYGEHGVDRHQLAIAAYTSDGMLDPRFGGDGRVTVSFGTQMPFFSSASIVTTNDFVAPIRRLVVAGGFGMARLIDVGPVITIGSLDLYGSEQGPDPAHFTVLRDQALPTPQRVYLNISGTATRPNTFPIRPADYTGTGITFVNPTQGTSYVDIPANDQWVNVTITPIDDAFVEGDEVATFTIAPHDLYDISAFSSTTLVIRDNDTVTPAVTSSSFNTETSPQRLVFSFNQDVSASFTLADILVQKLPAGPVIQLSGITHDTVLNTATVTINGLLPDGQYRATLQASGITNPAGVSLGTNSMFNFSFLRGDANRDGKVDVADLGILASNWQQSPRTFSQGDLNFDGKVDVADLGILASNWQQQLASPSAPFAGVPAKSSVRSHRLIDSMDIL